MLIKIIKLYHLIYNNNFFKVLLYMEEIQIYYLCDSCNNIKPKKNFSICDCNVICDHCLENYKCKCELSVIEIENIKKLKYKLLTIKDKIYFTYLREE